ncbi:MAG: glycosyltransferase [Bacteroidales bacterium]|nr:glycosyltransferase [Bacteroidales bacterium]
MKLSIITINYNNPDGLRRTIDSVAIQTTKDFEYIVIDGNSTQGDVEIIKEREFCIGYWVSEPDKGIYSAMNKGVRVAKGDYCLFLNSGDTLYSPKTVEEINNIDFDEDFIEGRIITGKGMACPPEKYTLASYLYKRNNYHQASLISRKLLLEYPYDEQLRIASDMKFNIEVLIVHNCSYRPIDIVISNYEPGGRSVTVEHTEEVQSIYNAFFPPRVMEDYKDYRIMHTFPVSSIKPLLQRMCDSYRLYQVKLFFEKIFRKPINKNELAELERRKSLKSRQ